MKRHSANRIAAPYSSGPRFAGRAAQHGVALAIALILLVVITLVGLAAIGTTILQQRMSANFYDRSIAFQSSEAAMRAAQVAITNATSGVGTPVTAAALAAAGFEDCSDLYNAPPVKCLANPFNDPGVPAADIVTVPASAFSASAVSASQPQYVVQYLGNFRMPTPKVRQIGGGPGTYGGSAFTDYADYYRITARSGDPMLVGNRAVVTLQSVFRK